MGVLGVAEGCDGDRAGSAVQRGARVVAEHRAPECAVAAGADDDQVGVLLLGLLVQAAAGAHRHDADELGFDIGRGALLLEQLVGCLALLSDQAGGDGVRWAQIAGVDVGER